MDLNTLMGITIPFLGTALGSGCVFFMKKQLGDMVRRALTGFAAGVMVAASIWSLIIPAIAKKISELKGIPVENVLRITEENTRRVFGISSM